MHTILILAHPGHELRIHHWLERNQPVVHVLTDGSGGKMAARSHYSRALIEQAGGRPGAVFGTLADRQCYAAIMAGDDALFRQLIERIVGDVPAAGRLQIVCDALDGYNPMHDLAFFIGCLVQQALMQQGRNLLPLQCSAATTNVAGRVVLRLPLDEQAQARKRAAVLAYLPLAEEARRIAVEDRQAYAQEQLIEQTLNWRDNYHPHWEQVGRERVATGTYADCLTFQDHMRPLLAKLFEGGNQA